MKPECQLIGENGNVFNLISVVRKCLQNNSPENVHQFDSDLAKITGSGGRYDDILALFMDYVDVV
jgi:hypothetical protein